MASQGFSHKYHYGSTVAVKLAGNADESQLTGQENPTNVSAEQLQSVNLYIDNEHRLGGERVNSSTTDFTVRLQSSLYRVRKLRLDRVTLPTPPNVNSENNHFKLVFSCSLYDQVGPPNGPNDGSEGYPISTVGRRWVITEGRVPVGYYTPRSYAAALENVLNNLVTAYVGSADFLNYPCVFRVTYDAARSRLVVSNPNDFYFTTENNADIIAGASDPARVYVSSITSPLTKDPPSGNEIYGMLLNNGSMVQFNYAASALNGGVWNQPSPSLPGGYTPVTTSSKFVFNPTLMLCGVTNDDTPGVLLGGVGSFSSQKVFFVNSVALNNFSVADTLVSDRSVFDDILGIVTVSTANAVDNMQNHHQRNTYTVTSAPVINLANPSKLLDSVIDIRITDENGNLFETLWPVVDRPFIRVNLVFSVTLL